MNAFRVIALLRRRPIQLALSVAASLLLGALLAATIYWTRFDPRWGVFLGGVLFAAVLATASSASKAEWIVARRTHQLDRLRARLKEAEAKGGRATDAFRAMELRVRSLADALQQPVILYDRNEVCGFHNPAAAQAAGRDPGGKSLREIFGEAGYEAMQPHIRASLAGRPAGYELTWEAAAGAARYRARQLPHSAGASAVEAVWLVLEPSTTAFHAESEDRTPGDAAYLSAIARELTGWDDPRGKITRALAEDRFLLYEQRIAPLEIGGADPLCHEILLRLQEEEDHHLPPGGFLPEAERLGLMSEIDRWVVRNLVGWCLARQGRERAWQPPLYCVNLSAAALRDAGFAHYVQTQLQRGLPGRALCFEIAEAEVIALPAEARRLVACLKPYGCRFTVDAFGSVKGSFAPLRDLALDFVKIDGVIVQNLRRDPTQLARVRAIAAACRKTGLRTIAEFVEDEATRVELRRAGVDYAQGFGIARPAPLGSPASVIPLATPALRITSA